MSVRTNTPKEQRARMLARLQQGPLTTLQARAELDIKHPGERIFELREEGHWIEKTTVRVTSADGRARSVARYKLVPVGARMPPSLVVRMLRPVKQKKGA